MDGILCTEEKYVITYSLFCYNNPFKQEGLFFIMKNMYFAHPVNVYNTPLEVELMEAIQSFFPDWHIENPNQPKHQEGYQKWLKETGNGMNYYLKEFLVNMDAVTGLSFKDGRIGAGVFGEEESIFKRTGNLWTLTYDKTLTKIDDFSLLQPLALTVEETRQRIYVGGKRENGIKGFFD